MSKRAKCLAGGIFFCFLSIVLLCACDDNGSSDAVLISDLAVVMPEEIYQESVWSGQDSEEKSAEEQEEDTGEYPDKDVRITISAVGDVSLGNHHEQEYPYSFRQTYDQLEDEGYFFENVRDIFKADDFTIVNLEGVLTFSDVFLEGQTYCIKGDPDYVYLMTAGSIEGVSMGNNHRLDYGEKGSRDTVAALEEAGIVYAYDNNVGTYEVKGIRIGFISVNEVAFGAGVEKILESGILKLQEEGADLILVSCHWGNEGEYEPEDYQTILGRKCIEWGADLVIGHHPHVLQGIEEYKGKYIIYSLGNFCFGANRNPEDKDTMIFQQTFIFQEGLMSERGVARIIPCSLSSISVRNDFRPTPSEGEEALRIIGKINELSEKYGVVIDQEGLIIN